MNKEELLKMAEESGVFHCASKFGFQSDAFSTSLEYFAKAILERAAVECEQSEAYRGSIFAARIRALKGE